MSAREQILARIRAIDRAPASAAARGYRTAGSLPADARLALFTERVGDYRADVHVVEPADVAATVQRALAERGAGRVAIPPELPVEWRPAAVELVEDGGLSPRRLDALDGVVTGCAAAIAETGTIVLAAGPAEGRRSLSLVPDLHVCIVRSGQIAELVPEAIALLDPRRPLTFVSGPSATSDIELSRVEGVHGPRTLVVIVVKEEP